MLARPRSSAADSIACTVAVLDDARQTSLEHHADAVADPSSSSRSVEITMTATPRAGRQL